MIEKSRTGVVQSYPSIQAVSVYSGAECMLDEAIGGQSGTFPDQTIGYTAPAGAGIIKYDVGGIMNACEHTYDSLTLSPSCWTQVHGLCIRKTSNGVYYSSGWRGVPAPVKPDLPPLLENYPVTEVMRARAFQAMYPEINDGLNLAVSLWEFGDIARTLMACKSLLLSIERWLRNPSIKDPTRGLAEYFLAYQFGIMPLIRDINGIIDRLVDLRRTLHDFKEQGKKPKYYHYREVLLDSVTDSISSHGKIYTRENVVYNATMKAIYEYEIPPFLEGFMRVGGLRITPATVWETIPFSFVVDWFLGIQKFLEQFDKDPRVKLVILGYCDTIKSTSQKAYTRSDDEQCFTPHWPPVGDSVIEDHKDLNPSDDDKSPMWAWKRVHYSRVPGIPNTGYALPVFDSLSNTQLVLGAALLRQQVHL